MSIIQRIFFTITMSLLLMSGTLLPAGRAMAAYQVTLSPDNGWTGDRITISGTSFGYSETFDRCVWIYFSKDNADFHDYISSDVEKYKILGFDLTKPEEGGSFETEFKVPAVLNDGPEAWAVIPGTYYIYVTVPGPFDTIRAKAVFTVNPGNNPDGGGEGDEEDNNTPPHNPANQWLEVNLPGTSGLILAPGTDVNDLAVSPDENTVYATDRESDSIYRSRDAGTSWVEIGKPAGIAEPQLVGVAPDSPGMVAIVADESEVYVSADYGESWQNLSPVQETGGAAATALYDIAISSNNSGITYVAVAGIEAGQSANIWYYDLGATEPAWKATNSLPGFAGTNSDVAMALAFSPNFSSDKIMVALTEEDDVGPGTDYVRYEIFNFNTLCWNESAGLAGYPAVIVSDEGITGIERASLVLSPDYDGDVQDTRVAFAGLTITGDSSASSQSGIYGLYDFDVTCLKNGPDTGSVAFNGSTLVAGSRNGDNAQVWRGTDVRTTGTFEPPARTLPGESRVVLAKAGTGILAGTSGESSALSLSTDAGQTFEVLGLESAGTDVSDMAVADDGITVYVTDIEADEIRMSADAGLSWDGLELPEGADEPQLVAVAPDNAAAAGIVADGNEVYFTNNGGTSWTGLGVPTDANTLTDIAVSTLKDSRYIAVSGNNGTTGEVWYHELDDGEWVEASNHDGFLAPSASGNGTAAICLAVAFSPNFACDKVLTAVTADSEGTYFQMFSFNSYEWNNAANFGGRWPVEIGNGSTPITDAAGASISLSPTYLGGDEVERVAFVGIRTGTLENAGVYRFKNYTVKAILTSKQIYSVMFDEVTLLAGEYDSPLVWRCINPLEASPVFEYPPGMEGTFTPGLKVPGGSSSPVLGFAGPFVVAGTTGNESCFSLSVDGRSFSDISLIDTSLTTLDDVATRSDGRHVYLAANDSADTSLWRYDGMWQRVLNLKGDTGYFVRVATDEDDIVYMIKQHGNNAFFSNDGGSIKWFDRYIDAAQDFAVESELAAYTLLEDGRVRKTVNGGFTWGLPGGNIVYPPVGAGELQRIVAAPDNADWAAVIIDDNEVHISNKGGLYWSSLGTAPDADIITDVAFSTMSGEEFFLAVSGNTTSGTAGVWYYGLGIGGHWKSAITAHPGEQAGTTLALAVAFSPNFASDRTLTAVTTDGTDTYFELLRFDDSPAWNETAGFADYPVTVRSGATSVDSIAATIALAPTFTADDAAARVAFIGIRAATPANSGIFRITECNCSALKTGIDINSLAFNGSSLVAGEYASTEVWRSSNPLDASPGFNAASTRPNGENRVLVAWAGSSILAGTSGDGSAFSVSTDGGNSFAERSYTGLETDVSDFSVACDAATIYQIDRESSKLNKSLDAGLTWFRDPSSIQGHSILLLGLDKIITATVDGYVSYSADGGKTWTDIAPQIRPDAQATQVAASGLSDGDYIYAGTDANSHVYRWKIGTSTQWEDIDAPNLPGCGVYGLALKHGNLYVLTSDNTSSSELLRTLNPEAGTPVWRRLGNVDDTLVCSPSALRSGGEINSFWAIGTTGNKLYGFTDTCSMFDIPLIPGWNLISSPYYVEPENKDVNELLADITDNLKVAWTYDACSDEWSNFATSGPSGDLTEMKDGPGYWLFMKNEDIIHVYGYVLPCTYPPQVPPEYRVCPGWNLIGFRSDAPRSVQGVNGYLNGIKYSVLYGFKDGVYYLVRHDDVLEPGYGYWLAVLEPGTIRG